jgi:hypothetical protein
MFILIHENYYFMYLTMLFYFIMFIFVIYYFHFIAQMLKNGSLHFLYIHTTF